jgi:CO/xanthine dehydrogenase FAD-binding subunit
VRRAFSGDVEIAATCTIAELSGFGKAAGLGLVEQCCRAFLASFKIWDMATVGGNRCNALPAGPVISLASAYEGVCLLQSLDGTSRRLPVTEFVTGAGRKDLADGELLRSVTLKARALERITAFRQASLYGLGRSGVLIIGTVHPGDGSFAVTITASTVRPFQLWFAEIPTTDELRRAIERIVPDDAWFDDIHGLPEWRRHMTLRLSEEIRKELAR